MTDRPLTTQQAQPPAASRERGAVTGATPAWILVMGDMPAIGALMAVSITLLSPSGLPRGRQLRAPGHRHPCADRAGIAVRSLADLGQATSRV